MITKIFRNPVVPKKTKGFTYEEKQADKLNIDVVEYRRRQVIINNECIEASMAGLYTGTRMFPKNPEYLEKYGECRVLGIARTVSDLASDWQERPLIIHAVPVLGGDGFYATANFFSKTNPTVEHHGD